MDPRRAFTQQKSLTATARTTDDQSRPGPDGTGTARSVLGPCHMGPQDTTSHQRSPTDKRNRRSTSVQLKQQAQRQLADQIVVPKVRLGALGQQMGSNRLP